ncbi:TIR domain-containing protein [Candidatus Pacearchaeota archaeon]|nr:TIR domain-containing protein [Candidatus Pacearchaeota archaeon]
MGGSGLSRNGDLTGAEKLKEIARRKLLGEKICDIFIPHAWDYDEEYDRLVKLLEGVEGFEFRDYSVPKEYPLEADSIRELEEALENQIKSVSVVVVPAGMYAAHREWIEKEIQIAKRLEKPIVAVQPWGSERIPQIVEQNADEIVGWNKESIVEAIRRVRSRDEK